MRADLARRVDPDIELGATFELVLLVAMRLANFAGRGMAGRLVGLGCVDFGQDLDIDVEGNDGQELRAVGLVLFDLGDGFFKALAEEKPLKVGV